MDFLRAYEEIVAHSATPEFSPEIARMRESFQRRTGSFRPEDPWFEVRSRAFWDDAVTLPGFAARVCATLGAGAYAAIATCLGRAHRGLFAVEDADEAGAHLADVWSGAEFEVRSLDEAQALAFRHAGGLIDARVVALPLRPLLGPEGPDAPDRTASASVHVLPGAFHHPADAVEPAMHVVAAARERNMTTWEALDALLRMELVLRSSSRVKAAFAYRVENLARTPRAD